MIAGVIGTAGSGEGGAQAVHDLLPSWAPRALAAVALAILALAATVSARIPAAGAVDFRDQTWHRLAGIDPIDAARWRYLRAIVRLTGQLSTAVVPLGLCFALADPAMATAVGGFIACVLFAGASVAAVPVVESNARVAFGLAACCGCSRPAWR